LAPIAYTPHGIYDRRLRDKRAQRGRAPAFQRRAGFLVGLCRASQNDGRAAGSIQIGGAHLVGAGGARMPTFTLCIFNETALANGAFAPGLSDVKASLVKVLAAEKIDVAVLQLPKNGSITKNLLAQRPAGTKILCLVDDASRGLKVSDMFALKLSDKQKREALEPRVLGMGPIRRPVIFLWDFEINGVKRYGDTFDARLRGSCLHELGHSFGLLHGKDAKGKERGDALDLMIPEPKTRDPTAHYVAADTAHMAQWVGIFLKYDKGGFQYPSA
jgi:hypothetical protein